MATNDNQIKIILGAGLLLLFLNSAKATTPAPSNGIIPSSGYVGPEGSLQESYLGISPTANNRGIRNNNPGNVKFGPSQWNGKIEEAQNTDSKITDPNHSRFGQPTFEQFWTWPQGVRVMIYLVKKYINVHNANTIDTIINRWAQGGNENYKNYLSQRSGKTRTQIIDSNDEPTIKSIVRSISNFENGQWAAGVPEVITTLQYNTARGIL